MKFKAKNEEEAEKIIDELDKLTDQLLRKIQVDPENTPGLKEYLEEELLELHYCRKGTRIRISTNDPQTRRMMISDVIGHLISEIPEKERNDVLLMAIKISTMDDLGQDKT